MLVESAVMFALAAFCALHERQQLACTVDVWKLLRNPASVKQCLQTPGAMEDAVEQHLCGRMWIYGNASSMRSWPDLMSPGRDDFIGADDDTDSAKPYSDENNST